MAELAQTLNEEEEAPAAAVADIPQSLEDDTPTWDGTGEFTYDEEPVEEPAATPTWDGTGEFQLESNEPHTVAMPDGQVVELPEGGLGRLINIFDRSYDKGTAQYQASVVGYQILQRGAGNKDPRLEARYAQLMTESSGDSPAEGWWEESISAAASQLPQLFAMAGNMAKRGLEGGLVGLLTGLIPGNPGKVGVKGVPTMARRALKGVSAGSLVGGAEHNFYQASANAYMEIREIKDANGVKVNDKAAQLMSYAAGAGSAGLEFIPLGILFKMVPGSKQMFANAGLRMAGSLILPKTKKAAVNFLINLSALSAAEVSTEVAQEAVVIGAGEVAKMLSPKGNFESVAAKYLWDRLAQTAEEAAKVTTILGPLASAPRLATDFVTPIELDVVPDDPQSTAVRHVSIVEVDTLAQKIADAPISEDLETYDVGPLSPQEREAMEFAGLEVTPEGQMPAKVAELFAGERARRMAQLTERASASQTQTEKDEASALRKVARGAIRKLDNTIKNLDVQVDDTLTIIAEREAQGKPVKSQKNKINRLLNAREKLDEERAGLLTDETPVGDRLSQARQALDNDIELKGAELLKAEQRLQVAKERAFNKGLKDGSRLARTDTKAAQEAVIEMLESEATDPDVKLPSKKPRTKKENISKKAKRKEGRLFKLSPEAKSKFIKRLKNVQSAEQFSKVMDDLQSAINVAVTKERRKVALKKLDKELRSSGVKKRKGKFGPEAQSDLDGMAKNYLNMTVEKAREALAKLPPPKTSRDRLIKGMLNLRADPESFSAQQIEDILLRVVQTKAEGRQSMKDGRSRADKQVDDTKAEILDQMGEVRDESDKGRSVREFFATAEVVSFLGLSGSWRVKMRRILRTSDGSRAQALIDKLGLFAETRVFNAGKVDMTQKFSDMATAALGLKSERQLRKKLAKDEVEKLNLGKFTHANGEFKTLDVRTRAQARARVMQMRDPDLEKSYRDEKGNGYTDDIIAAIEGALDESDYQLIEVQVEFYDAYYERINQVYERMNGFSLPKLVQYSPIRRENVDFVQSEFFESIQYRGSVAPGSLKSREPSVRRTVSTGDFTTLQSHIMEMEYYIAYAEKVQFISSVMRSPEVQNRIDDVFGKSIRTTINQDLDFFQRKGGRDSWAVEKLTATLLRNFTFAQLGFKPQIGLKQLASMSIYAQDVSTVDFVAGVAAFAKNPRAALKVLSESEQFSTRGMNIDKDFEALLSDKSMLNLVGKNPGLAKVIMLPIRYGDKGAIALGGYAHYHAMMKKNGGNHKAALDSFDRMTVDTQQSNDIDQLSVLQRSSPLLRVLSQFMSSANALARAEYSAVLDMRSKRINKREFAKRLFILHFLIPNTIQYIANGFTWDTEDQLRASLVGSLNGVFVFGDLVDAAARFATGGVEDVNDIGVRHQFEFGEDIVKLMAELTDDDISFEDWEDAMRVLDPAGNVVGALTGVPLTTVINEFRGLTGIGRTRRDGDARAAGMRMLGYSDYAVKNAQER